MNLITFMQGVWTYISTATQPVWDWLLNWNNIKVLLSVLGDVCLFYISFVTFRLTLYPKRLKFIGFRYNGGAFSGDSFEITVENRSLSPVVITSLELVVGTKRIKVFDGQRIVEGFKSETIEMPPYTKIVDSDGEPIDIDIFAMKKISLWIKTTRGAQHVPYERVPQFVARYIHKKEKKFQSTTVIRNYYNEKLVVSNIKYVLSFVDSTGELQTVFIHKGGTMSSAPFGYNGLPKEMVDNEELLKKHFGDELSKRGLSGKIERFNTYEVSGSETTEP